jgi:phosphomannomutase/phosphoglucomutase
MIQIPKHIFRAYDIRGVYGKDITEETAHAIGWAFARLTSERTGKKSPRITVGMDARLHSPDLRAALVAGLKLSGADTITLGLCPSPLTYYSAYELEDVDAFIMVTGSHNPPPENGFKLGIGTDALHSEDIQLLGDHTAEAPPLTGAADAVGDDYDITGHYIRQMSEQFASLGELAIRPDGKPITVVLDSGNGTAGPVLPPIMKAAGFNVIELFSEPDGNFPNHHPDPTLPETLESLREAVAQNGADLGMAFDGDADRVGVIDEKGNVIWGDMLLLMLAKELVNNSPKEEPPLIISEVKASELLYQGVRDAGGKALMWKTGHSLIKAKMKETGAKLAGEMSGHLFFADRYYGFDDAPYAAMRIVESYARALSRGDVESFSDFFSDLPKLHVTPEIRFPCAEEDKFRLVEGLREALGRHVADGLTPEIKEIIHVDGVRATFAGGWGLLRASNTQPVLVMRFEASSSRELDSYQALFEGILEGLKKG